MRSWAVHPPDCIHHRLRVFPVHGLSELLGHQKKSPRWQSKKTRELREGQLVRSCPLAWQVTSALGWGCRGGGGCQRQLLRVRARRRRRGAVGASPTVLSPGGHTQGHGSASILGRRARVSDRLQGSVTSSSRRLLPSSHQVGRRQPSGRSRSHSHYCTERCSLQSVRNRWSSRGGFP